MLIGPRSARIWRRLASRQSWNQFNAHFVEDLVHLTVIHTSKIDTMSSPAMRARSLYRRILRELPARSPSILANPSPMQKHIRADISQESNDASPSLAHQTLKPTERRLEEGEQYLQYLVAQRMYTTLLERYNPGMNMTEEDRVRLTARRVGMDLPVELARGNSSGRN